jgi:hypothetical protein
MDEAKEVALDIAKAGGAGLIGGARLAVVELSYVDKQGRGIPS